MPAAIKVRPPSRVAVTRPTRPTAPAMREPLPSDDAVDELILRLDDIPIPEMKLHVDGLRPTLGSWLYGLFHRTPVVAKPRKRTR